ncbi:TPA: restriction endonuclease, SacI family [Legionella pneumophila]
MQIKTPEEILQSVLSAANKDRVNSRINNVEIRKSIEYICKCTSNRAGVRLLMSCLLAKIENPNIDPRNPYTEIGTPNSFSGRTYDEKYLTAFINVNRLPCNPTTAFLTPTLRNIGKPLTTDVELVGRPRELYSETLKILEALATDRLDASDAFVEVVRLLLNLRDEKLARINSLIDEIKQGEGALPLSSESIVTVIEQHLACKNSSRLPVLIVAAAYKTAGEKLGERFLPLQSHNAADFQTGTLGDIEICLINENRIVTAYEMKMKRLTINDIDAAIAKILRAPIKPQNYIFITTDLIEPEVVSYAKKMYEETCGIEIVVLDCISFLKYFLHLFYRLREDYLQNYQQLLLQEPDSAVSQTLKEAFLILRRAAENN